MVEKNLWTALESVPGLTATQVEWQTLADGLWAPLEPFLNPMDQLASVLPCGLRNGNCGLGRLVVVHSPDNMVAVCQDEFQRCETTPIQEQDRVLYRLPGGPLAGLAHRLLVRPALERIFSFRAAAIHFRFGLSQARRDRAA